MCVFLVTIYSDGQIDLCNDYKVYNVLHFLKHKNHIFCNIIMIQHYIVVEIVAHLIFVQEIHVF